MQAFCQCRNHYRNCASKKRWKTASGLARWPSAGLLHHCVLSAWSSKTSRWGGWTKTHVTWEWFHTAEPGQVSLHIPLSQDGSLNPGARSLLTPSQTQHESFNLFWYVATIILWVIPFIMLKDVSLTLEALRWLCLYRNSDWIFRAFHGIIVIFFFSFFAETLSWENGFQFFKTDLHGNFGTHRKNDY